MKMLIKNILMFIYVWGILVIMGLVESSGEASTSDRTNLFPNPQLAGSGGFVDSWHRIVREGPYLLRHRPEEGPDGITALSITGSKDAANDEAAWYVDLYLVEGATYELTFQVKMIGEGSGLILMGSFISGEMIANPLRQFFKNNPQWQKVSHEFVATATGNLRLQVHIYGSGEIFFARPVLHMVKNSPLLYAEGEPVPAKGGALDSIVIGPDPGHVEISAAMDLKRIFKAITGKKIRISETAGSGRCLYIGCAPDAENLKDKLQGLGEEGIYLRITPKSIVCAGGGPRGTYYAVQELLYQMGCRWIWPGKYGECLPAKGPLPLPDKLSVRHSPAFELRGGTVVHHEWSVDKLASTIDHDNWIDWSARNRMNRLCPNYPGTTYDCEARRGYAWQDAPNHTLTNLLLPETEFEKHPEWFSLINGKRVIKDPKSGLATQPCVSNPEFINHITNKLREYFGSNPLAKRYIIGQKDSSAWCECDKCKALDSKPVDWSKNGEAWENSSDYFHMTDRFLYMVNIVAERIEKEFPGRWIGMLAYVNTWEPPVKFKPRPNVMIDWSASHTHCRKHALLDSDCLVNARGEKYAGGVEQLKRWLSIAPVSIYGYLDHHYWGIPSPFLSGDEDWYPSLHKLGVRYIGDETDTTPYASPVLLGLRTRLMWDINTKAKAFVKQFCEIAYGHAAKDMEAFWWFQDKAVMESPTEHSFENDFARYTPEIIKSSHELLDGALKRSLTEEQRARVQSARMAMLLVNYYHAQKTDTWLKMELAKQEILDIMKKYDFEIPIYLYNIIGATYKMPGLAIGGESLVSLPEEWLCRIDPQDRGEREKWYDPLSDVSDFNLISTNKPWEKQWVGAYDGAAWYVTDVVIPAVAASKRVWLLFGAVDDSWKVWLDGKSIGASEGEPVEIWDKPAAVDITGQYPPGKKARLVVRVHDIMGLGGIWKPVLITVSNKDASEDKGISPPAN